MGSDSIAIRVNGIGKRYSLGGPQQKYLTFRDAIVNSVKAPFTWFSSHEPHREFWALKNVSFDVEHGEVVGIIGRNGAGKSTLLKILSRITSPTEGTVDLYGRVGSLLEVGTGFHPELTGLENIFLSGSILGMKHQEIDEKLDDIVHFSDIEKFLDTPVKRYSSGMYVRLAFAVAAHMDTEILLVDEVLAVGDAAFQKKCLGKMGTVANDGRTVLFVSHNMAAIRNLCPRSIYLKNGSVTLDGNSGDIVEAYGNDPNSGTGDNNLALRKDRRGSGDVLITSVHISDESHRPVASVRPGQRCNIEIEYKSVWGKPLTDAVFGISIYSEGCRLINLSSEAAGKQFPRLESSGKVICKVDSLPLSPGIYSFNTICTIGSGVMDHVIDAGKLVVSDYDFRETGQLPVHNYTGILIRHEWFTDEESAVPGIQGDFP